MDPRRISLAAIVFTTACTKSTHETVKYEPIAPDPTPSARVAPAPVEADQPTPLAPPSDPATMVIPPPAPTAQAPPPFVPAGPQTIAAPPDIHAVDPSALIPGARKHAPPGSSLRRISVRYVGANGRVDLGATTYKASIRYSFRTPPIPATQTPGAPQGVVTPAHHFPDTIVLYEGTGGSVYYNPLGDANGTDVEPRCTVAQVWAAAIAAGAPAHALATATYPGSMMSARAWNFYVDGTAANGAPLFRVTIDDNTCQARSDDTLF